MATYPSLAPIDGSAVTWVDDLVADRAADGTVKVRAFYSGRKAAFSLKHYLTLAQVDTLLTFYDTNRLLAFDFTWPGSASPVSYSCKFTGPPKMEFTGANASVTVEFVQAD